MAGTSEACAELPAGTIHRFIRLLQCSFSQLGVRVEPLETERLAVMIHGAMSVGTRSFHTPEHVFPLADPGNPHITLAALFHDIVYFSVDQAFTPEVGEAVRDGVEERDGTLWLRPSRPADAAMRLCLGVFGLEAGRKLEASGGMNEFLSALVMNRRLAGAVPAADLLIATGCIEATIPFRRPDASGRTSADALFDRLAATARSFELALPAERLEKAVQWAVTFANNDVANFGEREVSRFLDNTWKLLPESNPSLRIQGVYSIRSYRTALQKMEGFLRFLDPDAVFARFRGVPAEEEFRGLRERAARNLATARDYLGIKLLTAAVLEALAQISGGDAPVSLFMGGIEAGPKGDRIEDHLPPCRPARGIPLDAALHDLLARGRASGSAFDLQNAPLSRFLYVHLGTERMRLCLDGARAMFGGTAAPRAFLEALPAGMVAAVARACARMAFTRTSTLEAYAASRCRGAHGNAAGNPTSSG